MWLPDVSAAGRLLSSSDEFYKIKQCLRIFAQVEYTTRVTWNQLLWKSHRIDGVLPQSLQYFRINIIVKISDLFY